MSTATIASNDHRFVLTTKFGVVYNEDCLTYDRYLTRAQANGYARLAAKTVGLAVQVRDLWTWHAPESPTSETCECYDCSGRYGCEPCYYGLPQDGTTDHTCWIPCDNCNAVPTSTGGCLCI